jgi:hypothetical protein
MTSIPTSKETICYAFLLINSFKSQSQGNSAYYFLFKTNIKCGEYVLTCQSQ